MEAEGGIFYCREPELPLLGEAVKIALIGTGNRARTKYLPLFPSVRPWVEPVAVCDPEKANADRAAEELGVPAFYDLRELVKARPMEAALIVTPVPAHYALSVYLSSHGIHNLAETSWCAMVSQGRQMIKTAKDHNVVIRVAENFYGFPIDRFAQLVKASGYLGRIGRIFSYADHTGYHNNSRWIRFAKAHPLWVQAITHTMETPPFRSMPQRFHERETFQSRYFMFPDNFLVVDSMANIKGFLGRHARPGYTEWQGEKGTLVHRARGGRRDFQPGGAFEDGVSELRLCTSDGVDEEFGVPLITSSATALSPVVYEYDEKTWLRCYAETPVGRLEYVNPCRLLQPVEHRTLEYGVPIMNHVIAFAAAVRGVARGEFDEQDALMSMMMEAGARESALNEGKRIPLPLGDDIETDALTRDHQKRQFGIDPLDVEATLAFDFPRP